MFGDFYMCVCVCVKAFDNKNYNVRLFGPDFTMKSFSSDFKLSPDQTYYQQYLAPGQNTMLFRIFPENPNNIHDLA